MNRQKMKAQAEYFPFHWRGENWETKAENGEFRCLRTPIQSERTPFILGADIPLLLEDEAAGAVY